MSTSDATSGNYQPIERPWLWVGIFFILGIVAADKFKLPFFILYLLSFVGFIGCFVGLRNKKVFFLSSLFLLVVFGFLRFQIADIIPQNNIGKFATKEKEKIILGGFVRNNPIKDKNYFGNQKTDFIFDVCHLVKDNQKITTSGLVKVSAYNKELENIEYGQSYILEGYLYKPKEPTESDQFNYADYLRRRKIFALFSVSKNDGYVHLNENKTNPILKAAYNLKNNLKNKYELLLPSPYSSLLTAFILGDRENIPKSIYTSFKHTGCIHILAISGLHVGMVIFIILALFKVLRVKKKTAVILCIIFLIFYCFLTGGRISVIRASIMGSIILLGWALNRDSDIYNSLGLSAFCILLFNPYQLFDVGFQLSFVAVFSIVYFTPRLEEIFKLLFKVFRNPTPSPLKRNIKTYFLKALCVSISAWLGTLPLTLYYFHLASNVTVIANLVVLPLLTIALCLGFLVSAMSLVWLAVAEIFSQSLWLILFVMVKFVHILGKAPFAYFQFKGLSTSMVFLYYFLLLGIFNIAKLPSLKWKIFPPRRWNS